MDQLFLIKRLIPQIMNI